MRGCIGTGNLLNGRYIIKCILGYGGYGITYKAYDSVLNINVAIKEYFPANLVMRAQNSQEVLLYNDECGDIYEKNIRNFVSEARYIAQFNENPNIIHIQEFFELNHTAYYVMEYLDGCDLRTYINQYKDKGTFMKTEEALKLIYGLLDALDSIHSKQIIHRDIKPENIYITSDNTVKLLDFGIAKILKGKEYSSIALTPGYASPEQYTRTKPNIKNDIYSTGAVMYEMLTNIRPQPAVDRLDCDKLINPNMINNHISERLNNIIMRMLSVNAYLRFKNIANVKKSLKSDSHVKNLDEIIKYRKICRYVIYIVFFLSIISFICSMIYLFQVRPM